MSVRVDIVLPVFRALADSTRVRILLLVRACELSVGELAAVLGQSQPRVSRHIKILADAGLLSRAKEGAWVFVRLGPSGISSPVLAAIAALEPNAGDADLARLGEVRAERAAAADAWFAARAASWDAERSLHVADADVEAAIEAALASSGGNAALGTLLDVGTGTGRMLELLGPRATRALGIDRSPEMLRLARGKVEAAGLAGTEVRHGDMYALPAAERTVDTVILHQVLHFAVDPAAALVEAARVLAPGGRLLIIDFAAHDRDELRGAHAHVRLGFADEQVTGWLTAAGLAARTMAHLPPPGPGALTVTLWLGERPRLPQELAA